MCVVEEKAGVRRTMELKITVGTETGRVRGHNEDAILLGHHIIREGTKDITVKLENSPGYLVAIADGMGGHNAGEVASVMVLELMRDKMKSLCRRLTENELAQEIEERAQEIQSCILEEGCRFPERKGMGTTLVGVLFYNSLAYYINAGDSRLYRFRDGCLAQITRDHSLREVTGDDAIPSNIIVNSFGGSDGVFIDFGPVSKKLFGGDILLLCSDGLSDMLPGDAIERIMTNCEDPLSMLLEEANNRGGTDNISAVLVQILA